MAEEGEGERKKNAWTKLISNHVSYLQQAEAVSPACSFLSAALFPEDSVEVGHKMHELLWQLQLAPSCLLLKDPSSIATDLLEISRKHHSYHTGRRELYYMHNYFFWSGAEK